MCADIDRCLLGTQMGVSVLVPRLAWALPQRTIINRHLKGNANFICLRWKENERVALCTGGDDKVTHPLQLQSRIATAIHPVIPSNNAYNRRQSSAMVAFAKSLVCLSVARPKPMSSCNIRTRIEDCQWYLLCAVWIKVNPNRDKEMIVYPKNYRPRSSQSGIL